MATKKTNAVMASINSIDTEQVLVTKDGLKKLKIELETLETDGRKKLAARLQEAISFGDLSENSEYQEAKEQQSFIEGRIIELTRMIKNAKLIDESHHAGTVNLASHVEIENFSEKQKESYIIVGATEVDVWSTPQKISNESPLGQNLLGLKKGDAFSIEAPGGKFDYKVLKVS
ncbi:transcription elongation factor GreA [Candidatus Peregrinibacteria bacterium]|nr:MAG: transcription elongation factor GreA [Candidatus Peregrinibacteria bacterium]